MKHPTRAKNEPRGACPFAPTTSALLQGHGEADGRHSYRLRGIRVLDTYKSMTAQSNAALAETTLASAAVLQSDKVAGPRIPVPNT